MSRDPDNPPSEWAGATDAGGGTYFSTGATQADIIVWHYCAQPEDADRYPRWLGQRVPLHTLVSMEPLHLEASLACAETPPCGWHGFLRRGVWTPV